MPSIAEAAGQQNTSMEAALKEGLETLSLNQVITFRKYMKVILPLDGYVFWVLSSLMAPGQQGDPDHLPVIAVKGSLHYSSQTIQAEASSYGQNAMVFTSEVEVQSFNLMNPDEIYIGEFDDIRFAFAARGKLYRQANLFHYVGDAIYPEMETQIIDALPFDQSVIVSNSLPLWLALNSYAPAHGYGNAVPLYPSFLVAENIVPPFGSVDIPPNGTVALMSAPLLGRNGQHDQLVQDTVRITLFGLHNAAAMNFVDCVNQYSLDTDAIGMMAMPVIRDEKRVQSELNIIGQKKSVEYVVSYYQSRAAGTARQLILKAIPSFIFPS